MLSILATLNFYQLLKPYSQIDYFILPNVTVNFTIGFISAAQPMWGQTRLYMNIIISNLMKNNDEVQQMEFFNLGHRHPVEVLNREVLCMEATYFHPCHIRGRTNRSFAQAPCQRNNYCNCCIRMFAFGLKTCANDRLEKPRKYSNFPILSNDHTLKNELRIRFLKITSGHNK